MKAPLTDSQKASRSINFGSQQGERPHSLGRELRDLRNDIEEAFVAFEGNDNLPVITGVNHVRTNFNNAGNAQNGAKLRINNLTLHGTNLLAGRSAASIKVYATGSTANYLTVSSIRPGIAGNSLAVEVVSAGADNDLSVDITDGKITVSLACAGGVIKDAADNNLTAIKAAIDGEIDDDFIVAITGDNTDIISAVIASANLAGGTGEGLEVVCSQDGTAVNLKLVSASNSSIVLVTNQDLGAQAAVGDAIGVSVSSHTAQSNTCLLHVLA
jgi:hypothetical protein